MLEVPQLKRATSGTGPQGCQNTSLPSSPPIVRVRILYSVRDLESKWWTAPALPSPLSTCLLSDLSVGPLGGTGSGKLLSSWTPSSTSPLNSRKRPVLGFHCNPFHMESTSEFMNCLSTDPWLCSLVIVRLIAL